MTHFDLSNIDLVLYDSIVSEHEMKLYTILTENLDTYYKDQYVICPKVRIGDIIKIKKENFDRSVRARYRSRHFDFVICSKDTLQPILAIELQDSSHKTGKGRYVDALKNELCKYSGLQLLQLWTTNAQHIKNLLYYKLTHDEIVV